jgi:peptide chain release factor 2
VTHIPTGISVAIQNERSQLQNKETALTILRSRLAQLQLEQHAEALTDIKGPSQSNEFGSQIRNYILDDRILKDLRTGYETHDPQKVLDGGLDPLIDSWLESK